MSFERSIGQSGDTGYDAIEALLGEARAALDQTTALDTMQSIIPDQPGPIDRDRADHIHHVTQEAEFHPLFNKLGRAEVVRLMLEEEERQHAAALATPDQPYAPSHTSDIRRTSAYLARKRGEQD